MIGAIAGDIIGSVYERCQIKTKDFPLFHPRCHFTDDTVLTVAIADAILTEDKREDKRVRSALGSLGLVRQNVGPEEGSFYLHQPRTAQSRKPAFSVRSTPPGSKSDSSS